jgi:hypothetical protein
MLFEVGRRFLFIIGLRRDRQITSEHPTGLSSQGIDAGLTFSSFFFIKFFIAFVNSEAIIIFSYAGHEHK